MNNRAKENYFSIIQWNCRSINSNRGNLELLLKNFDINIAAISETWLKPSLDFKMKGFHVIRSDRIDGKGGCLLLIDNKLDYINLQVLSPSPNIQLCGAQISLPDKSKVSIISCYAKPRAYLSSAEWLLIFQNVPPPYIFLGDFNMHSYEWGCRYQDAAGQALADFADSLNLIPLNDGSATRLSFGSVNPSIVDISFCSSSLFLQFAWNLLEDCMGSDHFPIYIKKIYPMPSRLVNFKPKFKIKSADWTLYQNHIINKFQETPRFSNTANRYKFLMHTINLAAELAIPRSKPYYGKKPVVCWWNHECEEVIKKRKRAHEQYKLNANLENFLSLKKSQAQAKRIILEAKRSSWRSFCSSLNPTSNVKEVWTTINKIKGTSNTKFRVPPNDVIEEFLDRLAPSSVPQDVINFNNFSDSADVLDIPFSMFELGKVLENCKDSSPGLDNIHYAMIKYLPVIALQFLLDIYNDIRYNHEIPSTWSEQKIVPILKPEKPCNAGASYRPIALSSCVLKIFEKLIKIRIETYLELNFKLPNLSFGFRTGGSTMDNLSILVCNIKEGFATKKYTSATFLDIEGAYDYVNLHILTHKLLELGMGKNTAALIYKLMHPRYIKVNSEVSTYTRMVFRGLPQGSILSPILFLCYTCDIFMAINPECKLLQYADDLVLYSSSSCLQQTFDNLNTSLNRLIEHLNKIELNISYTKSKVCIFARRRVPSISRLTLGGQEFPVVSRFKYLGLILDSKLLWKPQINLIIEKCSPKLNLLKIVAKFNWGAHPSTLIILYNALIRSHLEYGNFLFGDAAQSTLNPLDKIQYQAIRISLGYIRTSPTNAILVEANEPPLFLRRKLLAMKFYLKRKSKIYHPTIQAIEECSCAYYNTSFWNASNIPHLIQTSIQFHNMDLTIEKFSIPYVFKVNSDFLNVPIEISLTPLEEYKAVGSEKLIYTDGSKFSNNVGCAFLDSTNCFFQLFKLPKYFSIFSAELIAIREALYYIKIHKIQSAKIVSDSQSALASIQGIKNSKNIGKIQFEIMEHLKSISENKQKVALVWVRSHNNNRENELVDYLAKRAAFVGNTLQDGMPTKDLFNIFKGKLKIEWDLNWAYTSLTRGSKFKKIKCHPGPPWFSHLQVLQREHITFFNRLRINHTLCNAHLYRFSFNSTPFCNCSSTHATPEHLIFACPLFSAERNILYNEIVPHFRDPPSFLQILKTPKTEIVLALHNFFKSCHIKI